MDLFAVENKIRIIELNHVDVLKRTDNFNLTFELIRRHQENYPDIEKWFKTKVVPGIKSNERGVYVGFNNDKPIASAIVKKGEHAKFCHLHIEEESRHQNIGDVFFFLMSAAIRDYAKDVHFSLPESVWEAKSGFFKSYGFDSVKKYGTQYRIFEEELTASTNFNTIWSRIFEKLPSLIEKFDFPSESPLNGLIMSIQPHFSEQIMNGKKNVEIRKKFNVKWKNHKVAIYSSSPIKKLVGYATIEDVQEDKPDRIWTNFSKRLGCTQSQYDDYTKGLDKVYAISLSGVCRYSAPLPLHYLSNNFEYKIHPPQSYCTVRKDKDWTALLTIAELMHGRFNAFSHL